MVADLVLVKLGTAAVRAAAKLWVGDNKVAGEVTGSAVDLLSGRLTAELDKRKLKRVLGSLEDAVVTRVEPIIEAEYRNLPDNEKQAAILAVADTFEQAKLRDNDLLAADLDATRLYRVLQPQTRDLSADATQLYELLLREMCSYVIEISRGLPPFTPNVLTELLRRDREILDRVEEVLARLPQPRGGRTFDNIYRQLVAQTLDHVELFGVSVAETSRHYPLSVAYLSLTAANQATSQRVEHLLAGEQRVFIRGEAGLGKTTLLHWIAVRSGRQDFTAPLGDWNGTVPFFVPLRMYAGQRLPAPGQFLDEVGKNIRDEMPAGWVQEQLRGGTAVVLVDGVDELAADRVDETRVWLRDLVRDFPDARYVITSRPGNVRPDWLQGLDFAVVDLEPMTRADVSVFVERWYKAVGRPGPEHLDLLDQIATHGHLRRLSSYPLLCALLCALHRERGAALPNDRMELYRVALEMLIDRRDTKRGVATLPGLTSTTKTILLGDCAYWLIRNGLSSAERTRVIDRIHRQLPAMRQIETPAGEVYRYLLHRTGLLREPVEGRVDFVHKTFQDYLAALTAVDQDDVGTLVANADRDGWHDVVVMAVGHASRGQRAELLTGILQRGDDEPGRREKLHLLALAGLETAPELDPELRHRIETGGGELLPPKSVDAAKVFALGGQYLLDRLAATEPTTEQEIIATIRAAAETGLDEAMPVIARFAKDERGGVHRELMRNWSRFDAETYARTVLSAVPIGEGVLNERAKIPGLRHLCRMEGLVCRVPLASLAGVFPPNLKSLDLQVPGSTDLSPLADLPLTRLSLRGDGAEVDVAPLSRLSTLTTFRPYVPIRNLAALRDSVRNLRLQDAVQLPDLTAITGDWLLHGMSVINVDGLDDLSPLAFASGLRFLNIDGYVGMADRKPPLDLTGVEVWADSLVQLLVAGRDWLDFGPLRALTKLAKLNVGATGVVGLGALAGAPVTELAIGVLADPDELAVLGDLPQLRKLALKGWSRVDLAVLAGREDLVVEVGFSTSVQNEDRLGARSRVEREDPPPRRILPRRRYRPLG